MCGSLDKYGMFFGNQQFIMALEVASKMLGSAGTCSPHSSYCLLKCKVKALQQTNGHRTWKMRWFGSLGTAKELSWKWPDLLKYNEVNERPKQCLPKITELRIIYTFSHPANRYPPQRQENWAEHSLLARNGACVVNWAPYNEALSICNTELAWHGAQSYPPFQPWCSLKVME